MSGAESSGGRKILFFSGARADYGRLLPIWRAVQRCADLRMVLCVSGMHLVHGHGYTRSFFDKDGFPVDYEVPILSEEGDVADGMAKALGKGLVAMNDILLRERPDLVFVFGDRSEMLIPAIAAGHMNIPVAHMAGGFATFGLVDELVRHALTKMAHLHLATSKKCAGRIERMGEEPHRIHFVGSPAIDAIRAATYEDKASLFARHGFDPGRPLAVVTFHPVTTEYESMEAQAEIFFSALGDLDAQLLITYPNLDLGGRLIVERLQRLQGCRVEKDLSMTGYLSFLKHADVMVGNSSSGFIEAPYFALPVVNVGNRQMGRDREANVVDVPNEREAIVSAVRGILGDPGLRERIAAVFDNTYGDGTCAARTVEILRTVALGRVLLQKRMTY